MIHCSKYSKTQSKQPICSGLIFGTKETPDLAEYSIQASFAQWAQFSDRSALESSVQCRECKAVPGNVLSRWQCSVGWGPGRLWRPPPPCLRRGGHPAVGALGPTLQLFGPTRDLPLKPETLLQTTIKPSPTIRQEWGHADQQLGPHIQPLGGKEEKQSFYKRWQPS